MEWVKRGAPVLIAEDDQKTGTLVAAYLEREGFRTRLSHDGREALDMARSETPLLVILDLMLPGADGWEVCQTLRRDSDVPIVILSARQEELDRILGFTLGADDYVMKPFSPRELVARVKAILRRTRSQPLASKTRLSHGGLVLDLEKRVATLNNRRLALTPSEYCLLKTLMSSPGRVFERTELLTALYPDGEAVVDRVVDVHVGKLRQKIGDDPVRPSIILTVRGMGYQLAEAAAT
ncbi:response regulator transcription factor [Frigoriglobus tundricola]|uniref:Phosphate regulon transcriptional regulatory protein PhoB (SphR) n=1 Tax=Frigoriglobus tundricola TaxID=2774151 RepID=A0A6M5Z6F6_9BACT|nr:response regulator transcription factor [Frigoriglobus tundricola]QJX00813.1 Phosphate regulon transcriptional regulatory protein PhoB (SphR) [Frigoriglobus tundricola]